MDRLVQDAVDAALADPGMTGLNVGMLTLAGSRGYGLHRPDSDVDVRGVFVLPTRAFFTLDTRPVESVDVAEPDAVFYELQHFVNLATRANPQVLETLWMPSLMPADDPLRGLGEQLVAHRDLFLSTRVYDAYGGYANGQLRQAKAGTGGSRGQAHLRRDKFLLHTLRLLVQGVELLTTREVTMPMSDPAWLWEQARQGLDHVLEVAADLNRQLDQAREDTDLPDHPDFAALNDLVWDLRQTYA